MPAWTWESPWARRCARWLRGWCGGRAATASTGASWCSITGAASPRSTATTTRCWCTPASRWRRARSSRAPATAASRPDRTSITSSTWPDSRPTRCATGRSGRGWRREGVIESRPLRFSRLTSARQPCGRFAELSADAHVVGDEPPVIASERASLIPNVQKLRPHRRLPVRQRRHDSCARRSIHGQHVVHRGKCELGTLLESVGKEAQVPEVPISVEDHHPERFEEPYAKCVLGSKEPRLLQASRCFGPGIAAAE